jgi:hypothetical protein
MESQSNTLAAGSEVVVETVFGHYRGVLAQPHVRGSHVRLRAVGHDFWLHERSVNLVRKVGGEVGAPTQR